MPSHLGGLLRALSGAAEASEAAQLFQVGGASSSAARSSGPGRSTRTAFQVVECKDGFRCVSLLHKFGKNHIVEADVNDAEDADTLVDDNAPPVYEWNCPFNGQWSPYKFTVGNGPDECAAGSEDCVCISRSTPIFTTAVTNGDEVIDGQFKVDPTGTADTPDEGETKQLQVIPHFPVRNLPEGFKVGNPHSSMGSVITLPVGEYIIQYESHAMTMQETLDVYKQDLDNAMSKYAVGDICSGLSKAQLTLLQTKVRRFQILSSDCDVMRNTIAKVATLRRDEVFNGSFKGHQLQCYRDKESNDCRQLNCYNSAADLEFQNRLDEFRERLYRCIPEEDVTEENALPPELNQQRQKQASVSFPLAVAFPALATTACAMGTHRSLRSRLCVSRRSRGWQLGSAGIHFL